MKLRAAAWVLCGTIALVALHAAVLMAFDPREQPLDPVRITRPADRAGEATVLFAGDTAEADRALPSLVKHGYEYPFSLTVDLVRDADLAVANAEAPITDGGRPFPLYKDYVYRAPAASARALAWAGFDVLTLANNHSVDYGAGGLADTIANARSAGMEAIGAGSDGAEARRGLVAQLGDVRVGLLAYCEKQLLWRVWVDQFARPHHPGVAALVDRDLAADLARLRPQVDVLVVALHAGYNYAPPQPSTVRWAERAIDLGADLVVVHHPHVAHPVQMYKSKPILLSLGNYAFGTPGRDSLDYGWLALARIAGKRLRAVELQPLDVQNRRVEFRPRPLDGEELDRALEAMRRDSAGRGAPVRVESGRVILDVGAP